MPRSVLVRIGADITDLRSKLAQGGRAVRGFTGELDRAAKGQQLDEVANAAGAVGLGLVAAAGAAVKFAADFDKQMSAVSAATHASAAEMDQLRAAALRAGKDTSFSATEAAKGVEELAKAGVTTSAILSGGLKGALDLAAAGGLDVAEAAEIAATAMVQFKLSGGDVGHVADLLAAGAGKAQGSVTDLGYALKYAGLPAANLGVSIEETAGTLALFASNGLLGEQAGTGLRGVLASLSAPSTKAAGMMEELGIQVYGANGQFVGMAAVAEQLKTNLGGVSAAQRDMALATIFGRESMPAAIALMQAGAAGVADWTAKVDEAGYASDTASRKLDNLAGDVERLKGSLETLAIESATGATSGLRTIVQAGDRLVTSLSGIPAPAQNVAIVVAAVTGAMLLAAAGAVKLRAATAAAGTQLAEMGPRGEKAAAGMDKASKGIAKAGIALAALNAAGATMGSSVNPQIEGLVNNLDSFAVAGSKSGEVARIFGEDMDLLDQAVKDLADTGAWSSFIRGTGGLLEGLTGIGSLYDKSLQHSKERLNALDQALSQMVQSGNAEQARMAFDRVAASAAKQRVSVEELKKVLPGYAVAMEQAGSSAAGAAGATDEAGNALTGVAAAAKVAEENTKAAKEAFDELFGVQMSIDEAAIKSAESIESLSKAIDKNGSSLNVHTERGRANREAVLTRIKAIKDERQARIDNGMSVDLANKKYLEELGALRKTMNQSRMNKTQIDALVGAYEKIPGKVNTSVGVTGDKGVISRLQTLYAYQNALRIGKPMADIRKQLSKDNADFMKFFDTGGWTGPGDTHQPAGIVHADEFVVRKSSRKRIEAQHPGLLDEMNATGQLPPGYARGGWVWPYPVTAARTRIPSQREVASKVPFQFGSWPSSPGAQRGDSGVWRQVLALINSTGPLSGSYGNAYRHGDDKWHGSGRAVDWMGYNQDALASFLAGRRPLELIHRTNRRDYAYTRGRNFGSFDNALMEAHRNHIHIAMANGGVIREPVIGVGASGTSYSFGESGPEQVTPLTWRPGGGGATVIINLSLANHGAIGSRLEMQTWLADSLDSLNRSGRLPALTSR